MHAIFSRHDPHPIVLSSCAILYVISRLDHPTNWMDACLLHHYVVIYCHRQDVHAVESLRLVLEQIPEIVEVVHKKKIGVLYCGLPLSVEASPGERNGVIFEVIAAQRAEDVMDDWPTMSFPNYIIIGPYSIGRFDDNGFISDNEISPLAVHKISISFYFLPKQVLAVSMRDAIASSKIRCLSKENRASRGRAAKRK